MARLRLGYTKSRTGCQRCKHRRVKCDENKPCRACVRHGVECSLVTGHSPASPTLSVSTPQTAPSPRTAAGPHRDEPSSSSDPFPYFAKFVSGRPDSEIADWVSDMELLHQWSTSTFKTLVDPEATSAILRLWQVEVPQLSFKHTFLLHLILAISAYHLAYLRPENCQQYSLRASQHQNVAIRTMRDELSNVTPENCHALLAASAFLFTSVLAASQLEGIGSSPAPSPTIDDLIDVFVLIKGIRGLLDTSQSILITGPLKHLFAVYNVPDGGNLMLDRVINQLDMFLSCLREINTNSADSDKKTVDTIETATRCLMQMIRDAINHSTDPEYRVVTAFPIMMPDEYVPLLRQKNPLALVLLSYYCVVFHACELKYWFIKGWSEGVMMDISRIAKPPWIEHSAWSMGWISAAKNGIPD
ncbi:sterol uptake control protein 2 [Podospora fimiseda]|uniref:Sterol uptake control protein 2 n=1 Tax=Podospora fimiseda TaxID=252190 RepID=A0AAN7GUR8_9PEZI|nr:sterol uptake control protein 2 [Podospora fimiseda]